MRIAFVGAGPVAATLAQALARSGRNPIIFSSRDRARAEAVAGGILGAAVAETPQAAADAADLVFLTVPDDVIARACGSVVWRPGVSVVHCSGATELTALSAARDAGALVGAFHPLQMFADPAVALETLPGCTITIEADPPLGTVLQELCRQIGCRPVELPPGMRALYHASAYYVGPFMIALMQEAVAIWAGFGLSERDVLLALVPLLQGTVAAVMKGGLARGMGGCIARGDIGTVSRHLDALEVFSPDTAALYRDLALRTVPIGIARGSLPPETAERIRLLLENRRTAT